MAGRLFKALSCLAAVGCLQGEYTNHITTVSTNVDTTLQLDVTTGTTLNLTLEKYTSGRIVSTTAGPATTSKIPGNIGNIQIEAGYCDVTGHCSCSVTIPNPCTADEQYREIMTLKERVDVIDQYLNGSFLRNLSSNVAELTNRLQELENSTHNSAYLSDFELLRDELQSIVSLITILEGKDNSPVASTLKAELDSILKQLDRLESNNAVAIQSDLQLEIEALKSRLARCKEEPTSYGATPFPGDSIRKNETNFQSCVNVANKTLKIGQQVTHKWRDSGVPVSWYKDPQPNDSDSSIFEIRHNYATFTYLYVWSNYQDYSSAKSESTFRTKCSFAITGRKHVILNNHLYYYDLWSTLVSKMDLSTCKIVKTLKLAIEVSADNSYLVGEYTYADINYDETGMYVAYTASVYNGALMIAKIDPNTMLRLKTWETGRQKTTLANVFFICGKMYTTNSFTATHLTGKQVGYDTNSGAEFLVDLDVESRYNKVVQLTYNPREHMLIGVDNSHTVTYNVYWV